MYSEIILIVLVLVLFVLLNKEGKIETKDDFLINLAVLDRVIDDYVQIIHNAKIDVLRSMHNLNPESQVNSIKSFEVKVNETIKTSTIEIMNLLTRTTKKTLLKRFSSRSLALFISNKIKNS